MATPTTTDIQIATDTSFNTLSINETKPYCTTRTFIPDELPRGVDLYMRVRHHTDNASMDTPWSSTRQFQIEPDIKIIGVCMDNSDTAKAPVWDWIDKDGNKVDTFDSTTYPVYANAEGVTITDNENQTANFIKIPKFYVKTMASGPINTFAQGKKCWWIANKPTDGFRVHPAFLRNPDGTATDYIRICVNTDWINVDAGRAFDIYDFGLCVLLTYIQCKQTMITDTKMNPSFPNVDLGIQYLAWDFNTIIAGNYYYSNAVNGPYHVAIYNCMQLIDSPIPKISADKLTYIVSKSAQTFITLDDINDAAFKLESDNDLYLYYYSGQLKSGSVSIDNITIDFMDLFIPDLSVPHNSSSDDHYFYDRWDFTVSNDDGLASDFPFLVLMCYTSHSTGTIHFSPLCPEKFKEDNGTTDTIYDRMTSAEYKNFRVCLK